MRNQDPSVTLAPTLSPLSKRSAVRREHCLSQKIRRIARSLSKIEHSPRSSIEPGVRRGEASAESAICRDFPPTRPAIKLFVINNLQRTPSSAPKPAGCCGAWSETCAVRFGSPIKERALVLRLHRREVHHIHGRDFSGRLSSGKGLFIGRPEALSPEEWVRVRPA
jgi:hypothetical protein